jgi:putative IMPACT (imprinted ancient) family translation regulator
MSDDGEPHGTAGRPMLTALLHSGVGQIVAVCTRYYGGVKLGTGGLSRAYSGGVVHALEEMPRGEKVDRVQLRVVVGYAEVDGLHRLVDEMALVVVGEDFGGEVLMTLAVPTEDVDEVRRRVRDLTRGAGVVESDEESDPESDRESDEE